MNVSKQIVRLAPRMASSIAGKISSPLQSALTRLPGTICGPRSEPIERTNCGSARGVEVLDLPLDLLGAGREIRDDQDQQGADAEGDDDLHQVGRCRRAASCGTMKSSSVGGRTQRSNARNKVLENGKQANGAIAISTTVTI